MQNGQVGCKQDPVIHAVVYDSLNRIGLESAMNYRHQQYGIKYIGDLSDAYSEAVIINEDLEQEARKTYMRYLPPEAGKEIWITHDQQRHRSILDALSGELSVKLGRVCSPRMADQTDEARYALARQEHISWMVCMYSMGYVYGPIRDDIAKTHPLLVPFDQLSEEEKHKLLQWQP